MRRLNMKKHSKMYVEALGNVDKTKNYDVTEAIKVLKSLKTRKFDESVDLVLSLNIDAKKTDMNVRGSFVLPNGTGKTKRVLVVTKTKAAEATEADYCGAEDMLEKIEKENWFDFDTIVATPEMMPALGKPTASNRCRLGSAAPARGGAGCRWLPSARGQHQILAHSREPTRCAC